MEFNPTFLEDIARGPEAACLSVYVQMVVTMAWVPAEEFFRGEGLLMPRAFFFDVRHGPAPLPECTCEIPFLVALWGGCTEMPHGRQTGQ